MKAMVKKVISFFYPKASSSDARAPQLLDGLSNRCREVIVANMKQSVSLTLRILMSLHHHANLDIVGDGFAVTCTNEEGLKLMEDSALTANHIVEMVSVHIE
jgi:hypothetical protein